MSHNAFMGDVVLITPQSVFNAAWDRFIVKKQLPCIKGGQCAYEHLGRNCAVGAAMSEEQISILHAKRLENQLVEDLCEWYPEWFEGSIDTFSSLQYDLHDGLADTKTGSWRRDYDARKQRYLEIAAKFNLTIPEETNVQEG